MRGSRTRDRPARHVPAAADQATGVVLASTDVDSKTNEITRFDALLDQIGDLHGVVVTADALHCQRDHVAYLAARGAHPPVSSSPMRHRRSRSDAAVDCSTNRDASRPRSSTRSSTCKHTRRNRGSSPTGSAATRHHARNANRPLALLGIT